MLDFINRPELEKYIQSYKKDTTLFMEGDPSQDLYILVSGSLDLTKGNKKISEISEPGSLVGEIACLRHTKRSATGTATSDVRAALIPSSEVSAFLESCPAIAPEITRLLARRLLETTQVVHCYKEFCDQLPDAVIMTDKDLKILAWNMAAEKLYGRSWNQMCDQPIGEIYESQAVFQQFMDELKTQKTVRERPLKVKHPVENWLFVSTSTTALYDGQQNIGGYIFLGRDVTRFYQRHRAELKLKKWLLPVLLVVVLLAGSLLWQIPGWVRGQQLLNQRYQSFTAGITNLYPALVQDLAELMASGNLAQTTEVMARSLASKNAAPLGIKGLVLLDTDKNVVNAYSDRPDAATVQLLGSSYAAVTFATNNGALHHVVAGREQTGSDGRPETELAFKLNRGGDQLGWLLFQFDQAYLAREYGLRLKDLETLNLLPAAR